MFNKTKRKIVFTVVLSLLTLIIATMTTIYLSNYIATRERQEEMLKTYVEMYTLDGEEDQTDVPPDGELPPLPLDGREPKKDDPQFRLSTFYSVAYSKTGDVLAVRSGNSVMQSEQSLIEISSEVLNGGKTSGNKGNLFYLVSERDDFTLVAMIDRTLDNDSQSVLLRQILIIGTISTVILLVLSIFIARRIVKPLEENDRRQKRFISDAGHELKTPIAVISANSELLKRQIGDNEWLSNIDYENEKMSDLIKQLLFLSKTENGDVPKETLDFSKLTDGEILPFEAFAFENGKIIESDVEDGLTVEGNGNQLRQLVSILIDNALSHGTGKKVSLTLKKNRHAVILTVSNDAEELSAEQLSHLFDRFYRADDARRASGSHYGLGLSIAQAVVKAHGGEISAEYKHNKAVFTVSLPLKKD